MKKNSLFGFFNERKFDMLKKALRNRCNSIVQVLLYHIMLGEQRKGAS